MADLKLYSEAIDDYTLAITSEATGYEKEHLQDRRLDTSWKSTTTANQNIDIDRGAGTLESYDYILLDHDLPYLSNVQIFSATQSNYSDEAAITNAHSIESVGRIVRIMEIVSPDNKRYWRIKLTSLSAVAQIYLIFMGIEDEITLRYMMGQSEEKIYDGSNIVESLGGIRSARQYHNGRDRFEYAWDHLDATNEAKLQSIIDNVKGNALPFFMLGIDDVCHYVRLMNPRIGSKQVSHQLFNTDRLIFEEEF